MEDGRKIMTFLKKKKIFFPASVFTLYGQNQDRLKMSISPTRTLYKVAFYVHTTLTPRVVGMVRISH